ncbi:unnamed protein product, partial [Vitis vinifera]
MITCYTRNGELAKARNLFNLLPYKWNPVCCNAMVAGYAKNRQFDEARRLFDAMPAKDLVSWNSMLTGYTRNGEMRLGLQFFEEMAERDVVSWNLMVDGFVEVGDLNSSWEFFEKIPNPNTVSWVTMLCGFARFGKIAEARRLFDQMPIRNVVAWNAMIAAYVQNCHVDEAISLFMEMPEKNSISWTTVINGYVRMGKLDEARQLLNQMPYRNKPDQSTFACGLSSCAHLAALQVGKQLHQLVMKSGYATDLFVSNALITMYAKCGSISSAELLFKDIDHFDVVSWNSLIAAYALNGNGREALKLFHKMEVEGVAPDEVTFVGILSACSHVGLIDQGLKLFKCMVQAYNIEPLAEHYACMVDLLGRAGRLEEAFQLVRGMKINANAGIWGALLGACRIHGNLELAKFAAEKLLEFEPHKTSNYVLLSNMQAEAGRWDEVARVRRLMKEKGAEKQPGWSWIELQNRVHAFLSEDPAHPRAVELCHILRSLTAHMRNTGDMPLELDVTKEVAGTSHYNMQFQIPSLGLISMVEGPRALIPRKSPQFQGKAPQVFMQCLAAGGETPPPCSSATASFHSPRNQRSKFMSGVGTVKLLPKRRHFWLATLVAMFNPLIPLWITSGYLDCQMVVSPPQAMGQAADPPQSYYSLQVRLLRCQSPHSLLISVRLRNKGLIVALVLTVMTPHPVIQAVLLRIFLMQTVFIHFLKNAILELEAHEMKAVELLGNLGAWICSNVDWWLICTYPQAQFTMYIKLAR